MYDIIIIGSGIVGSVCALNLAMNTPLRIAILDSKPHHFHFDPDHYEHRVSAISLTSKKTLKNLNVWHEIQSKRISPFSRMHIWDHLTDGFIQFDAESQFETELGYIIEDQIIKSCLIQQFKKYPNIEYLCPVKLIQLQKKLNHIELILEDQSILSTQLIIGADGALSWVRAQAKIDVNIKDYGHTALVATVETEKPHEKTAWQRFMSDGPLAFLPLEHPHFCSIVWSSNHDHANTLLNLSDDLFKIELEKRFESKLGHIISVSKRYHFPLFMRHVKNYVLDYIALIGDAAHTIHPLAGQGLNLGLKDAIALSEVIIESHAKKRNFAKNYTLRRYERARKSDMLTMFCVIDGLKHLFASEKKPIISVRNTGLTMLNRMPFIKNYLADYVK